MRTRLLTAVAALFLLTLLAPQADALKAGLGTSNITPDVEKYDVPMAGYGARDGKPSTGVHDPLHGKVLYLEDGDTRMAIVTTDLRSMTPDFKNQLLEKIQGLGLNEENVLVCGSHNHSGPSFYAEKFWQLQFGEYDPAIVVSMTDALAEAVKEAVKNAAPAKIGFGQKQVEGFTRNRRWGYDTEVREAAGENPAVDPRLWMMRVDSMNGNALGLVVNFATHPTILGADNFLLTGEWPGFLQDALEEKIPGATVLYTNGAEGDQAPAGARGENDFEKAKDFGTRLAEEAANVARDIKTKPNLTLGYAYRRPELGEPVFSEAAKDGPYAFMEPFALEALPRQATLQQFRIGDIVLAALPGEPIIEVGLATEAAIRGAGADSAITIGLANDYIGYILNAKEYAHGGYEVDSRSYYGPGLGKLIARESGELAKSLFPEHHEPRRKALFNGENFEGWELFIPDDSVDPNTVWKARDGVVYCAGSPVGYMRTTKEYSDYRLTFEWRWPEGGGNNGVLFHIQEPDTVWPKSIEGQLQHQHAADLWVIGGADFKEHVDKSTRRVIKRHAPNEKPLGEWNTFEAICDGDTITLYVNDLLQNVATECTLSEGYIGFQSEGTPIEYRNIFIEPLEK